MGVVPTVRIQIDGEPVTINQSDFDPARHTRYRGSPLESAPPAARDRAAKAAAPVAIAEPAIWGLNVSQAVELANETPFEDLEGLLANERENPKHPGGRKSVLKAIADLLTG